MNETKTEFSIDIYKQKNVFLAVEQNKDFYNGFSSLFWHTFGSGRVSIDPEASVGLHGASKGSSVSLGFLSDSGMSSYPLSDSLSSSSSSSSDSLELSSSKNDKSNELNNKLETDLLPEAAHVHKKLSGSHFRACKRRPLVLQSLAF